MYVEYIIYKLKNVFAFRTLLGKSNQNIKSVKKSPQYAMSSVQKIYCCIAAVIGTARPTNKKI